MAQNTSPSSRSLGNPDGSHLKFSGRLDAEGVAGAWERALRSADETKPTLIDASDVEYCDGSGLALLWELKRRTGAEDLRAQAGDREAARNFWRDRTRKRAKNARPPIDAGGDWPDSARIWRKTSTNRSRFLGRSPCISLKHDASAPSVALDGCLGHLRARGGPGAWWWSA